MYKYFFLLLALPAFSSCRNDPSSPAFDCPFKELNSTGSEQTFTSGVEHNIEALLELKTNTRALKFGEIGLSLGDSIAIKDVLQKKETSGMVYSAEQVLKHNQITALICGNLRRAAALPEPERKKLETETNEMVKRYFDLLMSVTPVGTTGASGGTAPANTPPGNPGIKTQGAPTRPPAQDRPLRMAGVITDKAGIPLDSVSVTSGFFKTVWSSYGRFQVLLDKRPALGEVTIQFAKTGFKPLSRTYYQLSDENITVILEPK